MAGGHWAVAERLVLTALQRPGDPARYLDDFTELTRNPDGSSSETDRTGTITNETFQRAFPEWRGLSTLDWTYGRWSNDLVGRWRPERREAASAQRPQPPEALPRRNGLDGRAEPTVAAGSTIAGR